MSTTDNSLNPQFNAEPLRLEDLENRIINADCMDILRQLPDKCVDLVLTDPPYGGGEQDAWRGNKRSRFGGIFDKYHIEDRRKLEQEVPARGYL